ncbi:MAG: glycosyltransferase N-terminal domain-containing protein [Gammaproteobacteria bacterium]|nr:glycosyltransferase N-terminal domain-containing protein [Gammaproteobacteria bacterium]
MAKSIPQSTLSYRLLTWGLFPTALIYTGITAFKYRNCHYLTERLGLYQNPKNKNQVIWCHCASVGEINTALPLLSKLIENGEHLLVTTNTVTGKQALNKAQLKNTQHAFLPLDYHSLTRRLIRNFSPKFLLIFETELWPNILTTVKRHNIPSAIINGRISNKTLHAPSLVLKNYKKVLQNISKIIASSEESASRFIALGAEPNKIITLDNLKFANINSSSNVASHCPINYPFLLCASTHENEEQFIIDQWKTFDSKNLGLVIAVRHPHRSKNVCQLLDENKLSYCLHSKNSANISKDRIYIIDTLGQLMPFMSKAEFVFMGGSLVPVGGHNIIEPALFGRCILIGPYHEAFKDIVNDLITHDGILIIDDAEQLFNTIEMLVNNPIQKKQIGLNAKNYLDNKKNVLKTYQDEILKLFKDQV